MLNLFSDLDSPQTTPPVSPDPTQSYLKQFVELRPSGGFGLIMADAPWHQRMYSKKGETRSPQSHYRTMETEDIATLPVSALAADDCLLWFWAINNMLPQALDVIAAWGFQFATSGCWAKYNPATGKQGFSTGYVLRGAGEPFIIAKKGNPKVVGRSVRSVIMAKKRGHSQKPDEAFEACNQLMPDAKKIELFSRTNRPGWASWGDELNTIPMGS